MKQNLFKLFFQALLVCAILGTSLFGRPGDPVSFKNGETGVEVNMLSSNGNSMTVEFIFNGFNKNTVNINGNEYITLSGDGFRTLMEKGKPDLPVVRRSVIIPDLDNMKLRVIDSESTTIDSYPVAPSKGNFTRNIDPESISYSFDQLYSANEWFPQNTAFLDAPYILRDFRGQTIEVRPVQFNPVTNQLKVYTRMVVEIYSDNTESAVNPFNRTRTFNGFSKSYEGIYSNLFLNFSESRYTSLPEIGRLLIIYHSDYSAQIQPYADWKISKGIPTITAEYPTETGNGASSIQSYIETKYNETEGLTFIVLVGESDEIPTLSGNYEGAPSDPSYVKLVGNDAYPDAFISRISVTGTSNLEYVLHKIKRYEAEPFSGANSAWYLKGTGVASSEGSPPDYDRAGLLRDMLMDDMNFTDVDEIYDPGASTSEVTAAINEGRSVLNYIGHGSGTSWSTTGFDVSDVHGLSNGYKNPFFIDVACQNGDFTRNECFEEAWLRAGDLNDPKGAVAIYGASTNASWVPPCDMQSHATELLVNRDKQTVGGLCFNSVMYAMDQWGGSSGEGLKLMEQYNIFGDCSTVMTFGMIPDEVPPTTITDLAVLSRTSNSITLGWTSPQDSSVGGVTSYDIRYSTSPITNDSEFDAASSVLFGGAPDSAGMSKVYEFKNLDFAQGFYFVIKAQDVWANVSDMSNAVYGETYSAPTLSVTPASINKMLEVNQTVKDTIFVSNVSANISTLDYTVNLTNNTFPEGVKSKLVFVNNSTRTYTNKENAVETKGGSFRGFGGPDAFGYEWIDSDEENGPEFEWNDISSTGTTVSTWTAAGTYSAEDEGYFGPIDLGFDFKFYGETESQIYLSTNGFVTFDQISGSAFSNTTLPNDDVPNGMLCAFWDDLKVGAGSCYYKVEDSKVTIQYSNWGKYSGSGSIDFQIVIYKSGKIQYFYNSISCDVTSATVGIESPDNSMGLTVVNSASYLADGMVVQISAEPDWLNAATQSGTIYNDVTAAVELEFTTDDLEAGLYEMDVEILSNDPNNAMVTVPVKANVGNATLGWEATVNLADNEAKTSLNLTFGTDPLGTDGLDDLLGENELPPLPPTGVYDARFILPGGEMASLADYRGLDNATYTWTVKFQPNSTYGYPMHFNWNRADLPTDGMVVLRDKITGSIVNVDMTTASYYEVTNENITELEIVYTKMNMAEMNVSSGWNILSVPVHTPDMTVANMFPAATSEAFEFANGYQTVTEFEMGKGYWLKFDADAPHQMYGQEESFDVALNAGWNLVAGFNETVAVSDVTTNPAGIVNSVFYMFQDGYVVADELTPGYGYWVKASEAGDLVLNVAAKKGKTEPTEEMDALYTISMMVSDNGTGSYALGLGLDPNATEGIDSDLGETELPPMPPTGVFDARLMLPDGTTSSPMDYRTGDAGYSGTVEYDLSWQYSSGADALTLDIVIPEVPGTVEMTIVDGFGGAVFSQVVEEGTTQVVVDNANLSALNLNIAYTAPIPVELTGFAANVAGESINLEWSTATETNNKGFEVERSEDGENFSKIAFVDGMGTTTEAQSYIFTDRNAVGGTYYYRLRQVDFDGTYAYSDVVEVEFVPSEYSLQQNYPNPFNPSTTIKFALPVEAKVTVTLYNALGQRVNEIVSNNFTAGVQTVNFNASELASGMYIYQISAQGVDGSNFVDTKKMMLMK